MFLDDELTYILDEDCRFNTIFVTRLGLQITLPTLLSLFCIIPSVLAIFILRQFFYEGFVTGYIILSVFAIMHGAFKFNDHTNQISPDKIDLKTHNGIVDAEEERYMPEEEEKKALKNAEDNPKILDGSTRHSLAVILNRIGRF